LKNGEKVALLKKGIYPPNPILTPPPHVKRLLIFTALLIILTIGWHHFWKSPKIHLSGAAPLAGASIKIEPVEEYSLTALILQKKNYHFDNENKWSPLDLALAWGPVANQKTASQIKVVQENRFYHWFATPEALKNISKNDIRDNTANVHIIPATEEIKTQVSKLNRGDYARLEGKLVDVYHFKGEKTFTYKTSRIRTDEGPGACEIFLVEKVIPLNKIDLP